MTKDITLRKLESNADMRLIQQLERDVWDMSPVPTHQTFTASKNGGILVGAFDGEALVGYCYGFAGFKDGKTYLCSHMMGILPAYQSMGIGKRLKLEQRSIAKQMGYDLITWTFDPLESRNAHLNTSKLFGISRTYIEDCYGEMDDGLNRGLPTDRLQIEWWISSGRVEGSWTPEVDEYRNPFDISRSSLGFPVLQLPENDLPQGAEGYEVPVPQDFQTIKKQEPGLALDWRMKIRSVFQYLFEAGFAVTGVRKAEAGVHYYQFVPTDTIPLQPIERGDQH
ncbi:GNAT family N-acetyltransferase [Planococcus sp. N064]|uniref:GNAT family N-acetyltransferase n=1 Tax=Planococcus liqunii TaxID=3058394 RepID=A0ABT8MTR1_9BACL|nr:GNAT family N-acetyltransferase [Planococcus sp. N064]MDN7228116.1 GNAT family N-acetyltransferase [Planococcus sp. N064]